MNTTIKLKHAGFGLFLVILVFGLFSMCKPAQLSLDGWTFFPDKKNEVLTINHADLGILLKDVRLALKEKDGISGLSEWKVRSEKQKLIISTQKPKETTWTLSIAEKAITISCSADNAVVQGIAPASEDRIPARIESQDNEILYTSLGFVSSNNIYCLFDRGTDTMIQFPEQSDFKRNVLEKKSMDITFPVNGGCQISLIQDYYVDVLGLKYYRPKLERFQSAPVGWCSWYCYYMGTTEADMIKETDALAEYVKPYGLEYVQLDACFTKGKEANYLEWTKETFPQGGKWIFQYIKSKGLKPGLWVNIYGSNYAKAENTDKYPENFYLRDVDGNLSGACCTADKTVVRLDYSNPEVIEKHLKPMFTIFKEDWGLDYLKDAGWGTWMDYYDKNKERAYDPTRDSRELYVDAQKALRETLGPDVYILGCAMHEVGLGFGVFDGSRIGGDDKAIWHPEKEGGMSMQTYFHSLFGGNYLNNILWHSDPDTVMVRNPLTLDEARTIVTTIALTGQLYMVSDFMAKLPMKKLDLYRKTIPPTSVVPVDLYPYKIESNKKDGVVWCCPKVKEYPRAIDLKVNGVAGIYDVVAVFNWGEEVGTKTVSFGEDLGLETGREYLAFDFWNQELKEVTGDRITCSIPSHGTRVYVIRPILDRPQLVATSRHITGTISPKQVSWEPTQSALSGSSEIVEGAPYSLFIYVPEGMEVSKVEANTEVLFHKMSSRLLEVNFSGEFEKQGQTMLNWTIAFGTMRCHYSPDFAENRT
ncbi:MAG: hypothetical protein KAU46_01370 [Candidatus Aminicenantes bacterium]|nr:hypothetical protein [Candidatus Aminicenantes bacterium]